MIGNTMTSLLREYIRELLKEEDLTRSPETVGDLKALIDIALSTNNSAVKAKQFSFQYFESYILDLKY